MTETAVDYLMVHFDQLLKNLEYFSSQRGISLGYAERTDILHRKILEEISSISNTKFAHGRISTDNSIIDLNELLVNYPIGIDEARRVMIYSLNRYIANGRTFSTDKLSVEKLQERCDRYEKALTESRELLRDMNRECDGLSEPEETLYNIISQALAAIGGGDDRK